MKFKVNDPVYVFISPGPDSTDAAGATGFITSTPVNGSDLYGVRIIPYPGEMLVSETLLHERTEKE